MVERIPSLISMFLKYRHAIDISLESTADVYSGMGHFLSRGTNMTAIVFNIE